MGFGVESQTVKQQVLDSLAYTNERVLGQKEPDKDCFLSVKPLKLNKALRLRFIEEYTDLLTSYTEISERNNLSDDSVFMTSIAVHPVEGIVEMVVDWEVEN